MAKWQAQVFTDDEWKSVRSGAEPYSFDTAEEASALLRKFYPEAYRRDLLNMAQPLGGGIRHVQVLNTETGEASPAWKHT